MNTTELLKKYLEVIGFPEGDYEMKESQDTLGYLISITIKQEHPKVGILLGKRKRNLRILKQILRIVGFNEKVNPFLIVRVI